MGRKLSLRGSFKYAVLCLGSGSLYEAKYLKGPHPLTLGSPFSLLSTTPVESGFLHWYFVQCLYEGPSPCGHGLPHLYVTIKTNPPSNVRHAAHRAYTDSVLALCYLRALWPTPSCSHSTNLQVFLLLRFPQTSFYTQNWHKWTNLVFLHKSLIVTIVTYLEISNPTLSVWMDG